MANTNADDRYDIGTMDQLLSLHIKYSDQLLKIRKADLDAMEQSIKIGKAEVQLEVLIWQFQCMQNQYASYVHQMRVTTAKLEELKGDFFRLNFVNFPNPGNIPRIWFSYRRLVQYMNPSWLTTSMASGEARLSLINRCQSSFPSIGSKDHLDLIECLGAFKEIILNKASLLVADYQALQKGSLDVWAKADWSH